MAFDDLMLDAQKWGGALCSEPKYDPDLWFDAHTEQYAKEVCKLCPLLLMCAQYAMEQDEPYGVFGGLSTVDRRALRGKRSNAKFGSRPINK